MKQRLIITFGVIAATFTGFTALAGSEDRGAWFKSLRQPGTGMSCCDIADCRRTKADWHNGQWWAVVEGTWTPIPPNKELSKLSLDGDAYVCSGIARTIYCFVPPTMSM
jgi:hypothetical protein